MLPNRPPVAGFRVRGSQPTRVDAFVDAAFAFAVTLLVIAVGHVPASIQELSQALRGIPAFAASFYMLVRIWGAHRRWSLCFGMEDPGAVRLSLLLVFVVLLFVYPLRVLFALMFAGLSNGALAETPVGTITLMELRLAYAVFGAGLALIATLLAVMYRHALAHADALDLAPGERVRARTVLHSWAGVAGISLVSIALAVVLPLANGGLLPSVPGVAYALILPWRRWLAAREPRSLPR